MYTQCPECSIAFRVTAEVLRQAGGKVRCGGCSKPFNALDYLSEDTPSEPTPDPGEDQFPELIAEDEDLDSSLPKSISAEQSAALLKTLDQLAGSNIVIEDTGVEWRVLDADDESVANADDNNGDDLSSTGVEAADIDELLDDDPTPIDEFLTATPDVVDSPEIFFGAAADEEKSSLEELRFDDNTPLPEDFGLDEDFDDEIDDERDVDIDGSDEAVAIEAVVADTDDDDVISEPEPDIALSEPEEWTDILDEFDDDAAEFADELAAAAVADIAVEDDLGEDIEADPEAEAEDLSVDEPEVEDIEVEDSDIEEPEVEDIEVEDSDAEDLGEEYLEVEQETSEEEDQSELENSAVESLSFEQELAALEDDTDTDAVAETANEIVSLEDDGEHSDDIILETFAESTDDEVGFETIIMEGDTVHSTSDSGQYSAGSIAAKIAADMPAEETLPDHQSFLQRHKLAASVAGLAVLLLLQMMHQSREALATIPAFNKTVGQIYKVLGQPVQPAWDITGWRIEASDDVTDIEADKESLTVFSRIGNNSDQAMPYPLIKIALTDRFLKPIGSEILEPSDYLEANTDFQRLVDPGSTFNAVVAINSPPEGSSGYKIDVCYRVNEARVRCAIDDFK